MAGGCGGDGSFDVAAAVDSGLLEEVTADRTPSPEPFLTDEPLLPTEEPTPEPVEPSQEPEPVVPTEEPEPPPAVLSETADVSTYLTGTSVPGPLVGVGSTWVHFKTVDGDGYTVIEQLGSDSLGDGDSEDDYAETPERRDLVDKLRQQMTDAGWTETGIGTCWYCYTFGR